MIFNSQSIKILDINKKAKEIGTIRLDKGSPSPKLYKISGLEIIKDINSYPSAEGDPSLLNLIQEIEKNVNNRIVDKKEICLTNGALSGLFYIFSTIFDKGDKVLINNLSFEGFSAVLNMLGLISVDSNFEDYKEMEKILKQQRPKAIIINSPENPSGKLYDEGFFKFINQISEKFDLIIVSDEVNNQNVYFPFKYIPPCNFISPKRLISVSSFSKNYFLSGLRLGWLIGPEKIMAKILSSFSVSQVAVNIVSQTVANFVVRNFEKQIKDFREDLLKKKIAAERILDQERVNYLKPVTGGTVFFIETQKNGENLVQVLMNKYKIGAIPGVYFGKKWDKWLRLGFGVVSASEFEKGVKTIKRAQLDL